MLNTTSKPRMIIVESIDLRANPRAKKEIVRISVENEMDLNISPAEARKLASILTSYKFATE